MPGGRCCPGTDRGHNGDHATFAAGADRPEGYYNIASASFGLQAGVQVFSHALFFMTQPALDYLRRSDGWSLGTGPSIAVVDVGIANTIDTTTLTHDVYAFPFTQRGLMAAVQIQGSKITHIQPGP